MPQVEGPEALAEPRLGATGLDTLLTLAEALRAGDAVLATGASVVWRNLIGRAGWLVPDHPGLKDP